MAELIGGEPMAGIGERLRLTREALELKPGEFAGGAGIAKSTYSQWESGTRLPDLQFAMRLCDRYGLTLDWIYLGHLACLPYALAVKISAAQIAGPPLTDEAADGDP
jgi:transcriptional regulator with XRE-family HTH domain